VPAAAAQLLVRDDDGRAVSALGQRAGAILRRADAGMVLDLAAERARDRAADRTVGQEIQSVGQ
jgi:hypothetical protein